MINYEFPPIGGGTGNACYYMLKEFSQYADLEIDLVTFSPDNTNRVEQFADNIQIHYVRCGKKQALHSWKSKELLAWLISTYRYLKAHLRNQRYDLIHCWSGWPAGMLGYKFRNYAPYIVALRGSDVPGHTPRTALLDALVLRRLSRRIWQHAAAVTSVSRTLAALASKTASCDFQIINNGIDTKEFFPARSQDVSKPLRLLYVGRLNPHKGVDDLVSAINLVKADVNQPLADVLNLTIVGSGSMENEIRQSVAASGLDDVVTFKGILPHDQLAEIYREHDLLVFPCHSDAMANVILEAIASGLAILTTPTGGAELLDGNGQIIAVQDAVDLKQKMLKLTEETDVVKKMKQRSVKLATTMGWEVCCREYQSLYKTIALNAAHHS